MAATLAGSAAVLRLHGRVLLRRLPARAPAVLARRRRSPGSSSSSGRWARPARSAGRLAGRARLGARRARRAGARGGRADALARPVLPLVVVGLALVTLGNFSGVTAAQLGVAAATEQDRGLASALYFSSYYLAGALGGYVPGLAWERWEWPGVGAIALAAYAIGASGSSRAATLARPCAPSPAPPAAGWCSSRTRSACTAAPSWASTRAGASSSTLSAGAPRCANAEIAACNWLVDAPGGCARAARSPAPARRRRRRGLERFRDRRGGEAAAAVRAGRARAAGRARSRRRLTFDLLSSDREPVTTGHADGVVTLDLAESDDAHREAMREQMGEPYRTVLGHLRHEIGHYYWPLLVPDGPRASARARCSATSARTTRRRSTATTPSGPPPDWARAPRERLRDHAPVGGLGRDLRALPAHPRHAADRAAYGVTSRRPRDPAPDARADFEGLLADWLPLTSRSTRSTAAWAATTSTRSCCPRR